MQLISVLVHYFGLSESLLSREAIKPVQEAEELLRDIFSFGARSYGKKLSGAFFYFETYIEKMEQTLGKRLEQITFDGTMVPATVVPLQYQQEEQLQKRIGLLRKMKLI